MNFSKNGGGVKGGFWGGCPHFIYTALMIIFAYK
jgi:hypothetical protein